MAEALNKNVKEPPSTMPSSSLPSSAGGNRAVNTVEQVASESAPIPSTSAPISRAVLDTGISRTLPGSTRTPPAGEKVIRTIRKFNPNVAKSAAFKSLAQCLHEAKQKQQLQMQQKSSLAALGERKRAAESIPEKEDAKDEQSTSTIRNTCSDATSLAWPTAASATVDANNKNLPNSMPSFSSAKLSVPIITITKPPESPTENIKLGQGTFSGRMEDVKKMLKLKLISRQHQQQNTSEQSQTGVPAPMKKPPLESKLHLSTTCSESITTNTPKTATNTEPKNKEDLQITQKLPVKRSATNDDSKECPSSKVLRLVKVPTNSKEKPPTVLMTSSPAPSVVTISNNNIAQQARPQKLFILDPQKLSTFRNQIRISGNSLKECSTTSTALPPSGLNTFTQNSGGEAIRNQQMTATLPTRTTTQIANTIRIDDAILMPVSSASSDMSTATRPVFSLGQKPKVSEIPGSAAATATITKTTITPRNVPPTISVRPLTTLSGPITLKSAIPLDFTNNLPRLTLRPTALTQASSPSKQVVIRKLGTPVKGVVLPASLKLPSLSDSATSLVTTDTTAPAVITFPSTSGTPASQALPNDKLNLIKVKPKLCTVASEQLSSSTQQVQQKQQKQDVSSKPTTNSRLECFNQFLEKTQEEKLNDLQVAARSEKTPVLQRKQFFNLVDSEMLSPAEAPSEKDLGSQEPAHNYTRSQSTSSLNTSSSSSVNKLPIVLENKVLSVDERIDLANLLASKEAALLAKGKSGVHSVEVSRDGVRRNTGEMPEAKSDPKKIRRLVVTASNLKAKRKDLGSLAKIIASKANKIKQVHHTAKQDTPKAKVNTVSNPKICRLTLPQNRLPLKSIERMKKALAPNRPTRRAETAKKRVQAEEPSPQATVNAQEENQTSRPCDINESSTEMPAIQPLEQESTEVVANEALQPSNEETVEACQPAVSESLQPKVDEAVAGQLPVELDSSGDDFECREAWNVSYSSIDSSEDETEDGVSFITKMFGLAKAEPEEPQATLQTPSQATEMEAQNDDSSTVVISPAPSKTLNNSKQLSLSQILAIEKIAKNPNIKISRKPTTSLTRETLATAADDAKRTIESTGGAAKPSADVCIEVSTQSSESPETCKGQENKGQGLEGFYELDYQQAFQLPVQSREFNNSPAQSISVVKDENNKTILAIISTEQCFEEVSVDVILDSENSISLGPQENFPLSIIGGKTIIPTLDTHVKDALEKSDNDHRKHNIQENSNHSIQSQADAGSPSNAILSPANTASPTYSNGKDRGNGDERKANSGTSRCMQLQANDQFLFEYDIDAKETAAATKGNKFDKKSKPIEIGMTVITTGPDDSRIHTSSNESRTEEAAVNKATESQSDSYEKLAVTVIPAGTVIESTGSNLLKSAPESNAFDSLVEAEDLAGISEKADAKSLRSRQTKLADNITSQKNATSSSAQPRKRIKAVPVAVCSKMTKKRARVQIVKDTKPRQSTENAGHKESEDKLLENVMNALLQNNDNEAEGAGEATNAENRSMPSAKGSGDPDKSSRDIVEENNQVIACNAAKLVRQSGKKSSVALEQPRKEPRKSQKEENQPASPGGNDHPEQSAVDFFLEEETNTNSSSASLNATEDLPGFKESPECDKAATDITNPHVCVSVIKTLKPAIKASAARPAVIPLKKRWDLSRQKSQEEIYVVDDSSLNSSSSEDLRIDDVDEHDGGIDFLTNNQASASRVVQSDVANSSGTPTGAKETATSEAVERTIDREKPLEPPSRSELVSDSQVTVDAANASGDSSPMTATVAETVKESSNEQSSKESDNQDTVSLSSISETQMPHSKEATETEASTASFETNKSPTNFPSESTAAGSLFLEPSKSTNGVANSIRSPKSSTMTHQQDQMPESPLPSSQQEPNQNNTAVDESLTSSSQANIPDAIPTVKKKRGRPSKAKVSAIESPALMQLEEAHASEKMQELQPVSSRMARDQESASLVTRQKVKKLKLFTQDKQAEQQDSSKQRTDPLDLDSAVRFLADGSLLESALEEQERGSSSSLTVAKKRGRKRKIDENPNLASGDFLTPEDTKKRVTGRLLKTLTANDFNPRLLLITKRSQLDSDEVLTAKESADPTANPIKCGLCLERTTNKNWQHHLSEHYGVGWIEGIDEPLVVSSRSIVLSTMLNYIKLNRNCALTCRLCSKSYRSALGVLTHIENCGQEQVRVACPHCANLYTKLSLISHQRVCQTRAELKETRKLQKETAKETQQPEFNSLGRVKRLSSVKAANTLKELNTQLMLPQLLRDSKKFVLHIKTAKEYEIADLLNEGPVVCIKSEVESPISPNESAVEMPTTSKEAARQRRFLKVGYHCALCVKKAKVFRGKSLDECLKHIQGQHVELVDGSYALKYDFEDDGSEYKGSSGGESTDDDGASAVQSVAIPKGKQPRLKSKSRPSQPSKTPAGRKIVYPSRASDPTEVAVYNWRQFKSKNHSDTALYMFAKPLGREVCPTEVDVEAILPHQKESMKFTFDTKPTYMDSLGKPCLPPPNWSALKRFETTTCPDSTALHFVGAAIKSLLWIPLPDNVREQYFVVNYRNEDVLFTINQRPIASEDLLLIYKLASNDDSTLAPSLELHYSIRIPDGPIHCFSLMPSGGYDEQINRLALIAVGTINNSIKIYPLPIDPEKGPKINGSSRATTLANSEERLNGKILDIEPAMLLILHTQADFRPDLSVVNSQCLQICWSEFSLHKHIFAGFSNGFVGVWKICDDEETCVNRKLIDGTRHFLPLNYFYINEKCAKLLAVHYDSEGPRWLAVAGFLRRLTIYNIKTISRPLVVRVELLRNVLQSIDWCPFSPMLFLAFGDATENNGRNVVALNHCGVPYVRSRVDLSSSGVNRGHYNPLSNFYAYGTNNGDIVCLNMRELHLEHQVLWRVKHYPLAAVTQMDIKDLTGCEIPPYTSQKQELPDAFSYFVSDAKKKYGLVFGCLKKHTRTSHNLFVTPQRTPRVDLEPLLRVTALHCNTNEHGHAYVAIGYENGFIRLLKVDRAKFFK